MKKRKEEILKTSEQIFPRQFEKSSAETTQICREQRRAIVDSFLEALGQVARQAELRGQENGEWYLLFSCLHSGIFLKKYLIRIDMMNQEFYNDTFPSVAYWDAECIYHFFEKDIGEFRREVGKKVPRIREYEIDYIRYAYADYYHRMAKEFVREMMEEILENMQMLPESDRKGKKLKVLFGEYMGEADILFVLGRKVDEVF